MTQGAALAVISSNTTLPALIDRAVKALASARTAAEVLEARDLASAAYDLAKKTARLARAKQAHDEVIAAAYRAQADALEIEARAKRRLADEYDAAQERGEVRTQSDNQAYSKAEKAGPTDIGLTPKDIHDARLIRDAEVADPGIVRRTVDQAVAAGDEPTKAIVRRAVLRVVKDDAPAPQIGRGRDAVCSRLRDAITALCGLPPAAEAVAYFAGSDSAIVINEHIKQATAWLNEFRSAWGDANDADSH